MAATQRYCTLLKSPLISMDGNLYSNTITFSLDFIYLQQAKFNMRFLFIYAFQSIAGSCNIVIIEKQSESGKGRDWKN